MIKKYTTKKGEVRYMLQTYLGIDEMTGKQRRTTRRGFKTKKEAQRAEHLLQMEVEQNGFTQKTSRTFEEVAELWLEYYASTVKITTLSNTRKLYKIVLPHFKGRRIDKITPLYCQSVIQAIFEKYPPSFGLIYSVLGRIFKYALYLDEIDINPLSKVLKPRRKQLPQKENYFTREELLDFLDGLKELGLAPVYYPLFHLLAYTGLRRGEAVGLKWSDIDFSAKCLTVRRTAVVVNGVGQFCQEPKTKSSQRTISLDRSTLSILKHWRKTQIQLFFKNGIPFDNEEQYVFTKNCCSLLNLNYTNITFQSALEKLGCKKITMHGLRHTHASLLFSAGVSAKEIQERLGHSSIKTTLDTYTHLNSKLNEKIVDRFEQYMEVQRSQ